MASSAVMGVMVMMRLKMLNVCTVTIVAHVTMLDTVVMYIMMMKMTYGVQRCEGGDDDVVEEA